MQLDIAYVLRRLVIMDAAFFKIMEKHEVETLCLREKPSLE